MLPFDAARHLPPRKVILIRMCTVKRYDETGATRGASRFAVLGTTLNYSTPIAGRVPGRLPFDAAHHLHPIHPYPYV